MNDNQNDTPNGGTRIGDAERNEAVRRLGEHFEAGRLSSDEHSERVDQALRATTRDDLDALFRDLPRGTTGQQQGAQQGPPWARGGWRGPRFYGIPVPLLALVALLAVAGVACAVAGGHPPGLLILAAIITTVVLVKRRPATPTRA